MITSDLHARFCQNVKARRNELGLTQAELAKRLKVTQPVVAQIEAGTWVPTLDSVESIAKALEIDDPEDLLRFAEPAHV